MLSSPAEEEGRFSDEGPQHCVTLAAYELSKTTVTERQYARFEPDRKVRNKNLPVVNVSWWEAWLFCRWLGAELPTEAQWECGCRAGTTTAYWSGDGEEDLARVDWYSGNSKGRLHPVGEKPANRFGLHDMHGNVWEWCRDWFGSYDEHPVEGPEGERQLKGSGDRVNRGGSFGYDARSARSAYRDRLHPSSRFFCLGFRAAKGTTG